MSAPSFLPTTLLTTCTVLALTALSGCNNHTLVGVHYDNSQVCDESVNVPIVKPQVVLVVDRSGSMSDNPLSEGTRWEALHGVISEVVDGQDRNTQFGLAMFPAGSAGDTFPEGATITTLCARWPRRTETTNVNEKLTSSSSPRRSSPASARWPATSRACGTTPRPRSATASG